MSMHRFGGRGVHWGSHWREYDCDDASCQHIAIATRLGYALVRQRVVGEEMHVEAVVVAVTEYGVLVGALTLHLMPEPWTTTILVASLHCSS